METKKNGVIVVSVGVLAIAALGYLFFSENSEHSENLQSLAGNEKFDEQSIDKNRDSNIVNVPVEYPDSVSYTHLTLPTICSV